MKKLREMFETEKNTPTKGEGIAYIAAGLTWFALGAVRPIALVFIAIGLEEMIKARKNNRNFNK